MQSRRRPPIPASSAAIAGFHQLIRPLMRFFERSPERRGDLLHIPLGVVCPGQCPLRRRTKSESSSACEPANWWTATSSSRRLTSIWVMAPIWVRKAAIIWPRSGRAPCPQTFFLRANCPAPYRRIPSMLMAVTYLAQPRKLIRIVPDQIQQAVQGPRAVRLPHSGRARGWSDRG